MFSQRSSGLEELLRRPKKSAWKAFLDAPCLYVAEKLYSSRHVIPAQPVSNAVSVICISDTHNHQPHLPTGDVLIHAGDLTQSGSFQEVQAALTWLDNQPFQHKVVIAGNHDTILDASLDARDSERKDYSASREKLNWGNITYLEHSVTTLTCSNGRSLRIYGSPYSPKHGNWAFQYPKRSDVWSQRVPGKLDILVTHAPPRGHLDLMRLGCVHLLRELWRTRPRLHVFGHVHEGYGQEWINFNALQEAYERTVMAGGGGFNLLNVLYEFIRSGLQTPIESRCLLVNPSIVGGLRDEKRRDPIRVII